LIVDVILAAGRGTRVGSTKSLLDLGGQTLLTRVLDEVLASTLSGAIVVLGSQANEVMPLTRRERVTAVVNEGFDAGQLSSLQAGLRALPVTARAFLIHPVDHCLVNRRHVDALAGAWEQSADPSTAITRPVFGGEWGHPVLYAAGYASEFLALATGESGRVVYRRHLARVIPVLTADPDCLFDLDTPADLAEARRRLV
jgi:molybdenum cofactor cytidylyltransferase